MYHYRSGSQKELLKRHTETNDLSHWLEHNPSNKISLVLSKKTAGDPQDESREPEPR